MSAAVRIQVGVEGHCWQGKELLCRAWQKKKILPRERPYTGKAVERFPWGPQLSRGRVCFRDCLGAQGAASTHRSSKSSLRLHRNLGETGTGPPSSQLGCLIPPIILERERKKNTTPM